MTGDYIIILDNKKILKLQNAIKLGNFEVDNFDAHSDMKSRIYDKETNEDGLKSNRKFIAERKMMNRIIRLKTKNQTIENMSVSDMHQNVLPDKTFSNQWKRSGDIYSGSGLDIKAVEIRKSLATSQKSLKHMKTRSFGSFTRNKSKLIIQLMKFRNKEFEK